MMLRSAFLATLLSLLLASPCLAKNPIRTIEGTVTKVSDGDTFQLLAVLLIVLIYFVPVIWVLLSGRSRGGAKFGWFIVAVLFSWLGLAVFLIVTQAVDRKLPGRNETSKIYDKEF